MTLNKQFYIEKGKPSEIIIMGNIDLSTNEAIKSEAEIIERSKHSPSAFAPLYDKYHNVVLRFVLFRTGNENTAT